MACIIYRSIGDVKYLDRNFNELHVKQTEAIVEMLVVRVSAIMSIFAVVILLLEPISNESATTGSPFEFNTSLILFSSIRTNRYYIAAIPSSPPFLSVCARLFAHIHTYLLVTLSLWPKPKHKFSSFLCFIFLVFFFFRFNPFSSSAFSVIFRSLRIHRTF